MCISFPEWFIYENNCTLAGYNIFETFASSAKDKVWGCNEIWDKLGKI